MESKTQRPLDNSLPVSDDNLISDDGNRATYQLPNGARLVLSRQRQAKKQLQQSEQLSPRQYRKAKQRRARDRKAANSGVTPSN